MGGRGQRRHRRNETGWGWKTGTVWDDLGGTGMNWDLGWDLRGTHPKEVRSPQNTREGAQITIQKERTAVGDCQQNECEVQGSARTCKEETQGRGGKVQVKVQSPGGAGTNEVCLPLAFLRQPGKEQGMECKKPGAKRAVRQGTSTQKDRGGRLGGSQMTQHWPVVSISGPVGEERVRDVLVAFLFRAPNSH